MLTIEPCLRSSMPAIAAVVRYMGAKKLTAMSRSTSSAVVRAALRWMLIPALLTRMSSRPNRCSTSAMTRSHSSRDEMSAGTGIDAAAYCRHWSMISSSLSLRRATAATVAPRRARSVATVAPIPDDAPVTTATRPAISTARFPRVLAESREREDARGRRLLGAPRAEEDALADHRDAGVARRRQRERVDEEAVVRVPDLQRSSNPGSDERHPAGESRRPERLRCDALPFDGTALRIERVDARLLYETVVRIRERAAQG